MKILIERPITQLFVLLSLLSLIFSCATTPELGEKPSSKTPEVLAEGKRLYEENCVQCHGPKGDGKGWKAAEIRKKPRDFTLPLDQWNYSHGDPKKIFEVLKKGLPDTPMAMFHFTDDQRWALVHRVMEFSRGNSSEAKDPKKGAPSGK